MKRVILLLTGFLGVLSLLSLALGQITGPPGSGAGGGSVASGSTALATASIPANSCATVVTATATGATASSVINFTPNASIKAASGYTPSGTLTITAYPTANAVNFDVCNKDPSTASTPSAVTLNWKVF